MAVVNLDTATRLDIICRKGDTFTLTIDFNTILTDDHPASQWKMQVRDSDDGTGGPNTAPPNTFSTTESNFTVDVENLTIDIPPSSTASWNSGTYVYDLQTDDGAGGVKTWLYGTFTVNEDITE
jgi:hypothetical protein